MKTERASGGLPAGRAFCHKFDAIADRRRRHRKVFQDLSPRRQQSIAIKDLRIAFFQRVIEISVGVAQQTLADLVDAVVVERIAPGIATGLTFEMLRQHPRIVLHRREVRIDCVDRVVRGTLLLSTNKIYFHLETSA